MKRVRSSAGTRPRYEANLGGACPLCGGVAESSFTTTDRNQATTKRVFVYRRCVVCGTYFIADLPADLSTYYPEQYYDGLFRTDAKPVSSQDRADQELLNSAAADESFGLEILGRFVTPGRLVEVGAGWGAFARAASAAGFDVTAIEMDPRACAHLSSVGIRAINSNSSAEILSKLPPSRVIAMWHVLEHLPDPWEVLARAAENLEAGGVLILAMPNPGALQFRLLRARWAHVDAPRHLFLIPAHTLTAKARTLGLDCRLMTSSDPVGWNHFGWTNSLRRDPAARRSTPLATIAGISLTTLMRPLERHGLNGAAYTAAFVKGPRS